jgi:hypothetical protein
VLAVYANAARNGFAYDDKNIFQSPLLHQPWDLKAFFFGNGFYPDNDQDVQLYRPLSNLFYVLNHRVNESFTGTGASAFGFHVVGIAMHATVACLVYAWLMRMQIGRKIALTAAVVFAVLPIHSEVVANIYNRSEAQAAIFGLVFLILNLWGAWLPAAIAYLLALWSKESAIAFLPVAMVGDWFMASKTASAPAAPRASR